MPSKKAVSEGNARRNKNKERKKKRKRSAEESDACFEKVKCFRRNSWKPGVYIYIYIFYLVSLTGACILTCCLLTCYWRFDTARVHCTFFISWVSCFSFFFSIKKKNAVIMLRTLSFLYLRSQSRDSHQDESFFFFCSVCFRLLFLSPFLHFL